MGKNFDTLCKNYKISETQKLKIINIMNEYFNKTDSYTWSSLKRDFLDKVAIEWSGLKLILNAFYKDDAYESVIIKFLEDYTKNHSKDVPLEIKEMYKDLCKRGLIKKL